MSQYQGSTPKKTNFKQLSRLRPSLFDTLDLRVVIEDMFKIGTAEPKLTVVCFQNIYDKRQVMKYKHYLKGQKNRRGDSYFINDYIPAVVMERRNREKQIKKQLADLPNPPEITFVKGNMKIGEELFRPKVSPPTPKDIVDTDPERLNKLLKMEIQGTDSKIIQDKSIFNAYCASVSSYQQIRESLCQNETNGTNSSSHRLRFLSKRRSPTPSISKLL